MSDLTEPMATKNSNPITGITLEGFQVFDKPTYIPLERLTLLFGPNSAGKSAVQDAIELYEILLKSEAKKLDYFSMLLGVPGAPEILERHWRRRGEERNQCVDRLSISVKHTTNCIVDEVIADQLGRELLDDSSRMCRDSLELESRWSFLRIEDEHDEDSLSCRWDFEFFIESELVVSYVGLNFVVNLNHPVLKNITKEVNFLAVAEAHPELVSISGGLVNFHACVSGFQPSAIGFRSAGPRWLSEISIATGREAGTAVTHENRLLHTAIAELSLLVGTALTVSQGNSNFSPMKVDASRMVPTREELTFQIGNLDYPMQIASPDQNKKYKSLAVSLASELTNSQEIPETTQIVPGLPTPATRRKYADAVNRALSDHLFIEHGYRLDYDFRLLMSKANSQAAIDGYELDTSEFGFLVELFLRDGKGRKHLFEDVGSGLGYLLPVLCAVFERSGWCSTCFIQQPELHIHPALQAAMGDVFIEGSEEDRQVLIETHSEHLLLRILKRIRQTHLQASIAPELKIKADDVCVLYFDPSPDGTTTVKRLRITEDGEFMDRWPRGFFAERDQELLDE
jgi:AAA domain, putative AbiEii toxin, Type IV TA system